MTYDYCRRPYRIGSAYPLTQNNLDLLISLIESPEKPSETELSGRSGIKKADLHYLGKVVVKQYFRGGILRHVNRSTYLYTGKTRGRAEFEMLRRVRQIGVNTPEPVAFVRRGNLRYHAWLVTRELPGVRTLSELSRQAPESARAVMPEVGSQIRTLICHGIYHVDLHPGNVLVDEQNTVYFVDFDKARVCRARQEKLRHRYAERWTRAVRKYGLPAFITEGMLPELANENRTAAK